MATLRIKASWSAQFYLSITDEFGVIETRPYRKFSDGEIAPQGDSIVAADATELATHLIQFEAGNLLNYWSYFDEDDVCRNGKPIAECECC